MNETIKRIRALQLEIDGHLKKAAEYAGGDNPDMEKAATELDQASEKQKQVDVLNRLVEAEKQHIPADEVKAADETVDGFKVMAKLLRGQTLTKAELKSISLTEKDAQQLVTGENALNGENYLCPEDIDTTIRELRRDYVQAADYITVEPTRMISGRCVIEQTEMKGLISFDDGDTIDSSDAPKFGSLPWTISWYGALIPVSQILEDAERASLISYLNRWFVRKAVYSENAEIFDTLKAGYNSGTAKAITGCDGLRESINLDLNSASRRGGVILTNQTGYNTLDKEKDGNGRSYMQPDPTQSGVYRFRGMIVVEFDDEELANDEDTGAAPIFYGNLKAAAIMKKYKNLLLASSAHAGFAKAQTLFRIIEGFTVISADTKSYVYGLLSAAE